MFLVLGKLKTDFRAVIVDNCELLVKRRLERLLVALPYECRRHPLGLKSHWSKQKPEIALFLQALFRAIYFHSLDPSVTRAHAQKWTKWYAAVSTKAVAFATMPISVMGSKRKAFLD